MTLITWALFMAATWLAITILVCRIYGQIREREGYQKGVRLTNNTTDRIFPPTGDMAQEACDEA